jgi:hypothetical protein
VKRRGFLGLLGMAPVVPLVAKELAKAPAAAASDVWQLQPLDAEKRPWCDCGPTNAACRELEAGELAYIRYPSEYTRQIELTATFLTAIKGAPLPHYSRVYFMGNPVLTMPTQAWGEATGDSVTIVQNIQIN